LKMPRVIGVRLTGRLSGWASPKDVILKLAGILTVKGGTNAILEYFGEGAAALSATGKATICNMGAEVGATTSLFAYDEAISRYLRATERAEVADLADALHADLKPDAEVVAAPERYYDRVIEIDLSALEPHLNGPFTPDAAHTVSEFGAWVREKGIPQQMEIGLIGSCTNSSYEDLSRAASVAQQALAKGLKPKAKLVINPGSEQVRYTAERDGFLPTLLALGGTVMANACGPCIGQWARHEPDNTRPNSIVTSFNRNFAKRADGNPNTHAFVASPEMVMALTIAGDLTFNPMTDTLMNDKGERVKLDEPCGDELPARGFEVKENGYIAPDPKGGAEVVIAPDSQRLQRLQPFAAWDGEDFTDLRLLIKASGKCTTDHISMAGPWLKYRGHLENISGNLLMGAVNRFNGETNKVLNTLDGSYDGVSAVARQYKAQGIESIVVAEENYGEGSSREHAALEPRFLNVKVVLVKSFARIHETNLKKQGMLALTFVDPADYDRIRETDRMAVTGLKAFAPGSRMTITLHHSDGTTESFEATHTYNEQQIRWFKAGAALNC
ncbi:MAG: aconitate hydratase, partial [Alistipes sp.]|nr:aconitate hydratase [Alistipes sp.]